MKTENKTKITKEDVMNMLEDYDELNKFPVVSLKNTIIDDCGNFLVIDVSTKKFPKAVTLLDKDSLIVLETSGWTGRISPHQATSNKRPNVNVKIRGKNTKVHRVITHFNWKLVDHINRNPMDNRLCNLREADKSMNSINRDKEFDVGVCFDKSRDKWMAYIDRTSRRYLGRFDTKEDAMEARKKAEANYE